MELTSLLTTRTDDGHATPVSNPKFINLRVDIQELVSLYA